MSYATSAVAQGTPLEARARPVRVLIADDHPVVRQGLKMMLSSDPEMCVVGDDDAHRVRSPLLRGPLYDGRSCVAHA